MSPSSRAAGGEYPAPNGEHHERPDAYSGQDDADRYYEVHRLPRMPGRVQTLERTRRGGNGVRGLLGFQNPATLSAKTLTLITFHELPDDAAPGGLHYLFTMRRCLHCLEPACASACPTTALQRQPDGPVTYDADKCIGCRYCVWSCPWGVPTTEWDSLTPKINKCTHCADRADSAASAGAQWTGAHAGGKAAISRKRGRTCLCEGLPRGCAAVWRAGPDAQEAHNRISSHPDKYVDHVYGEKEAGGTSVLYLSSVPFEKLGFPEVDDKPYPAFSKVRAPRGSASRAGGRRHAGRDLSFTETKSRIARWPEADAAHGNPTFAPLQALGRRSTLLLALMASVCFR